jgi:hypothetical protein
MRLFGKDKLTPQQPHHPACNKHPAEKHDKAIQAIAHHFARRFTVCDAEYDGGEQCKQRRRAEMIESNCHFFIRN